MQEKNIKNPENNSMPKAQSFLQVASCWRDRWARDSCLGTDTAWINSCHVCILEFDGIWVWIANVILAG